MAYARRQLRFLPAAAMLLLLAGCGQETDGTGNPAAGTAIPVSVAPVLEKTMPLLVQAIGNVVASATVSVRSRVGGALQKVHFREGDEVSAGELLFVIDPRPYEAALRQAEGLLARDQALQEKAEADLRRFSELIKDDFVSEEQLDQVRASAASLRASVRADEAAVKTAALELSYCRIYAPISGRTGDLLVDEGNLIKANDDLMVVINQIVPIEASFSVPEQHLSEIRARHAQRPLQVTALVKQDGFRPVEGRLTFVNNTVDTATGTVLLKASFNNEDRALWPGQFVDVALTLGEQSQAIVTPSEAVQSGQQGAYVFVVREDGTAESRTVEVSRIVGEDTVIAQGLTAGETVVVDGQLRLVPGAKVEIKAPPAAQGATR
ncbi:MAG: efflux RND transporter periplasmic adaptor subunit [bacterium]